METHKIISVKNVCGRELNPRWKSDMQVVVTDKGEFIDNMPGITFGRYSPGFDWQSSIGKTVSNIQVISNSGHLWLNRPPLTASEIERRAEEIAYQTAAKITTDIINKTATQDYKKRKGILVLGASAIKSKDIKGIARSNGIDPDRICIEDEYNKNTIDINILVNCRRYDWLLIGPTAHNLLGLGDYNSLLSRLTDEKNPIIPHIILSEYAGSLKITKENIRNAFQEIAKKESAQ